MKIDKDPHTSSVSILNTEKAYNRNWCNVIECVKDNNPLVNINSGPTSSDITM